MTWLGLVTVVLLVLSCMIGYHRGFIKEAVSMLFVVLSMMIVWAINPYVNEFLKENTPVYDMIKTNTSSLLGSQLQSDSGLGREMQGQIINSLPLPDAIKQSMVINNNSEVYSLLAVDTFTDYIADYLATLILNGIGFLLSYFLASIAIRIISNILDIMSRLPVVRGVNAAAGFVVGGLRGLIFLWIAMLILTLLCQTTYGKIGIQMVNDDKILSFLYQRNLFVQVFLSIFYGK